MSIDSIVDSMAGLAVVGIGAGVVMKVTDAALGTPKKSGKSKSALAGNSSHKKTLQRVHDHDKKMRKAVFGK